MVVAGYTISVNDNYICINGRARFGLIRKSSGLTNNDIDRILESDEREFQVGDFSIQKLKPHETDRFPAARFHNAVVLFDYSDMPECFPVPIAMLYSGNKRVNLRNTPEEGYFISRQFRGIKLSDCINELDKISLENILRTIGARLKVLSEKGMYPLDLCPFDIFLTGHISDTVSYPTPLIFSNTEHVKFDITLVDQPLLDVSQERTRFNDIRFLWLRELYKGYLGNL